jgi:hypothetical protein
MPSTDAVEYLAGGEPGPFGAGQRDFKFAQNLQVQRFKVTAKTSSYSLLESDSGGLFTTTGASGAVTFTLPAVSGSAGLNYWIFNTVDQNIIITGPADTLVVKNDAAADSLTHDTSNEKIGHSFFCVSDGSKWLIFNFAFAGATAGTIAS